MVVQTISTGSITTAVDRMEAKWLVVRKIIGRIGEPGSAALDYSLDGAAGDGWRTPMPICMAVFSGKTTSRPRAMKWM